jgi:hypothetical protein
MNTACKCPQLSSINRSGSAHRGSKFPFLMFLVALAIATGCGDLQARVFTGATGTKVEAEIVSVALAKSTVRLRLPNGHEADVPFANLSEADREYLRQWKPADAPTVPPSPGTPPASAVGQPAGVNGLTARNPVNKPPLGAPGETIVLEFPELAEDRQGGKAVCKVRLPDNYDAAKPMPLLLWLSPGAGSHDPHGGLSLVDTSTWAVAAMPFPKNAEPPNIAFGKKQMPIIRDYHMAMLKKLIEAVPNVDPMLRFAAGHSNGAHCVATYMADGEREFINYFRGFIIVEGGCLTFKAKKKLRNSYAYVAWGDSEGNNEGFMAGIKATIEDAKLKATTRVMAGVGHDFPDAERAAVKAWIEKVAAPGLASAKP